MLCSEESREEGPTGRASQPWGLVPCDPTCNAAEQVSVLHQHPLRINDRAKEWQPRVAVCGSLKTIFGRFAKYVSECAMQVLVWMVWCLEGKVNEVRDNEAHGVRMVWLVRFAQVGWRKRVYGEDQGGNQPTFFLCLD